MLKTQVDPKYHVPLVGPLANPGETRLDIPSEIWGEKAGKAHHFFQKQLGEKGPTQTNSQMLRLVEFKGSNHKFINYCHWFGTVAPEILTFTCVDRIVCWDIVNHSRSLLDVDLGVNTLLYRHLSWCKGMCSS